MSIINDALKKAAKSKGSVQQKSSILVSKMDEIKTDAQRVVLRRWLLWTGTGLASVLGIVLAVTSFRSPVKQAAFDFGQQPEVETIPSLPEASSAVPVKNADLILSGVLYDQQNPMAIINEHVLSVGGLVNDARVVEIQPGLVRLAREGKEFSLRIK